MKHLLYKPWIDSLLLLCRKRSYESSSNASSKHFKPLLFLAFLLLSLLSSGRTYGQAAENTDWQLLKETEGVKAYYMINNCSSQDFVFFKLINSNSTDKKFIWGATSGSNEVSPLTISPKVLKGGEEILSDCNHPTEFLSLRIDEGFDISNLKFTLFILP